MATLGSPDVFSLATDLQADLRDVVQGSGIVSHAGVRSRVPNSPPDRPLDTSKLQAALVRLLRPLVRMFVRRGITFPAACDMLRELYVNVAEHDFALWPGKSRPTVGSAC